MSPTPAARAARDAEAARTSLRRRLRIGLTSAGALLAVLIAAAGGALALVQERQGAVVREYFLAVVEADASYVALVDAETAVRGYLLTGDPVILEPFERLAARPQETQDVDALLSARFGPDHPLVTQRTEATTAAGRWYTEFAEPSVERVRADGLGAVSPADVAAGHALFDAVQQEAGEYRTLLRESRAAAVADLQTWTTVLLVAVVALALSAVVAGTLLWVYLRRWVTDPLTRLARDARTVADGDTAHPVHKTGPGEVGAVAQDVELMRQRLLRLVAEAADTQHALEESHARLRDQAEDLSRSNRDLEQFAYVASHDLQEPLRKVASFTQLLAKRYEGQLDERADQYIAYAVDGAKRMQRLISDLLGFSRVGRIGGELAEVDVQAAVGQVVDDLEQLISDHEAQVLAEDLPVVRGEEPLLIQLLVNLIGNAIKFRHPERDPVVRIEARRVGDFWEFACCDNGIGIDPQYADRVFVIFQRLHAKEVYEGTGIGLALCKKIVEYHGGEIWIDAGAPEGTTVRWTLPVDPAEQRGHVVRSDGADLEDTGVAVGDTEDGAP